MKRSVILFTIVSFLSFGDTFAQINKGDFSLLVNIPTPIGKFGKVMGIRTGLGFGIEYVYPVDAPGISWITSASLLLDDVGNFDGLREGIASIGPFGPVIKGLYYNIPILTGFKFHGLTPCKISGYGLAQLGLNFVKPSSRSSGGGTYEESYDFAKSFGFGIGGGLVFYNKFDVRLQIYSFREAKIKGERKNNGETEAMKESNQSVSIFLVTFGIKF